MNVRLKILLFGFLFVGKILFAQISYVNYTITPNDTICPPDTVHFLAHHTPGYSCIFSCCSQPGTAGIVNIMGTDSVGGINFYMHFSSPGVYTFTLTPQNTSPLKDSIFTMVVLPNTASVNITANPTDSLCIGQAISFTATPTNGGTNPMYQWQVNSVNVGTNSPYFSSSGLNNNDVVSVSLTSNARCVIGPAIASYTVHTKNPVTPSVSIVQNLTSTCLGGFITFTATPVNGGSNPTFQWFVNGNPVGTNASNYTLTSVNGGELVSVMLTSNKYCVTTNTAISNTITTFIIPPPTYTIVSGKINVCPNEPDTLSISGPNTAVYNWTSTSGLNVISNNSAQVSNNNSGTYTYYVTCLAFGCTTTDSVSINISNNLTALAGQNQTICSGRSTTLSVSGGTSWLWQPSTTLNCSTCQHPIASPTATTVYTVTATNFGCSAITTQTISVLQSAQASFTSQIISPGLPETILFTNTSTFAGGCYWNFSGNAFSTQQNPAHTYNQAANYPVTLIAYAVNGCNDTTHFILNIADTTGIIIPNIFTPNGDGANDLFTLNIHGFQTTGFVIYDRWGLQVFQSVDAQNSWDGRTTSDIECTEGVYYYIFDGVGTNGKVYKLKGFLQLIR